MSKISLIIQREYITRVRKRSFLVISILGPLLFAGIIFVPALLASAKNENQRIVVVDETKSLCGILENNATVHYDYGYCNVGISEVKKNICRFCTCLSSLCTQNRTTGSSAVIF